MKGGCYVVLRTDVFGGWSDCRGSAFGRGGRGRGPNFLGFVLDRDRVGRDTCDHGAHRSGCVTGGCRAVRQFSGVMTWHQREAEASILYIGGQSDER
jgi:hypothetical protein